MLKLILNHKYKIGETPLMYAVNSRNYELFKYIVNNGADLNTGSGLTALTHACLSRQFKMVKYLVKHNCQISCTNYENRHYYIPAFVAASCYGPLKIIKCLIKHGAMITEKDTNTNTALTEAVVHGHFEIVNYIKKITLKRIKL